jgi:hypothetical protein
VAFTTFLAIQALLVGVTVVLLRPGTAALATRALGAEVGRADLRLLAGTVVAASALVVVGVLVLNGVGTALQMLVVSAVAAVAAEGLSRLLDRPSVQRRVVAGVGRSLQWGEAAGRCAGEVLVRSARSAGREVTSRARRAGEAQAARRR